MKLKESIGIVLSLRKEGLTYQAIGEKLKISRQRVYQIIQESNKKRDAWDEGLGIRNRNLLKSLGVTTKEQAKELVHTRKIKPFMQKNYGYRSFNDLCQWLGIDCDTKVSKLCPHCSKSLK